MASPNSSQARVFASATARVAARLASRYPSATSGVPPANHKPIGLLQLDSVPYCRYPLPGSGIAAATGTATLRPQLRAAALTIDTENMVHLDSMSPTSPGIWSKLSGVEYIPG
ncbi:hypothetical protein AMECASPLE_036916 [Ameca splendens]|uniref:Uncharacterized protein n=1 Tax=Ameca splendens TaxID=208324 RepID=A0ABV0ZGH4_9TELE